MAEVQGQRIEPRYLFGVCDECGALDDWGPDGHYPDCPYLAPFDLDDQRAVLVAAVRLRAEIRDEIAALRENLYGDWTDGDWHHRRIAKAAEEVERVAIGDALRREREATHAYADQQRRREHDTTS